MMTLVPSGTWHGSPGGLEEALIKSITVCKYKKNDGFIEGTVCSVCLSEFQENENLRLLPKCNHGFHLPCIDTWLKCHASCPLCRASVTSHDILPHQGSTTVQESAPRTTTTTTTALQYQHRISDAAVLVIQDLERRVHQQETIVSIQEVEGRQQSTEAGDDGIQPVIRRSVSMNISSSGQTHLTVSDILRISEDCMDDDRLTSHGEKNKSGVPSDISMKRSISTGRFMFTGCEKGKGSGNPHPG
ncbi:hypothetical protein Tsubulata_036644 [Turnera subulata]|uniref:RING-type E3 ubiquitin transferase n=1 Tax=Turnera subulata TaxID=218843 RepID=A0A9Q0FQF9_9ROSI|nr:hypothetical protein Tsubulata_036644 [Turnera subulata]